jgi:hypothetical protein
MVHIACIVEGQGDVVSVPILVRRIAGSHGRYDVNIVGPFRIPRNTLVRPSELERAVERAARATGGPGGAVLVLVDADDDAPCLLGPRLQARAAAARDDMPVAVVLANREKEAWFIAAVESLRGRRGVPTNAEPPDGPEQIRGAKEWLFRGYSEITDQPALSSLFDMGVARARSSSFDKFYREVLRILETIGPLPINP